MIRLIILLLIFSMPKISHAVDSGNTAANFLKINVGARAIAMGGAYTGISDDISAVYWNPGGLGRLQRKEIFLMHNEWLQDVRHDCLIMGMPTKYGVFALSSNLFSIDSDNSWKARDAVYGIGWGYNLSKLSLGINLKSISEQIASKKGNCIGADMGILYNFLPWLKMGVSCQNIGQELKIIKEGYRLPFTVRVGETFILPKLLLSLDTSFQVDNEPVYAVGIEYTLTKYIALRYGWKSQDEGLGSLYDLAEGTSFGIGVKLPLGNIDYAYLPCGLLGEAQQVSLCLRFNQIKKRQINNTIDSMTVLRFDELESFTQKARLRPPLVNTPMPTQPREEAVTETDSSGKGSIEPQQETGTYTAKIIEEKASIYTEPKGDSPIIAAVAAGTMVTVLDRSMKWYYKVQLSDGRIGWVSYLYVEP
ncbi:MAG: PorV/PorQ family protein [bacterium]|nr:PorV/PorQ family protein [bacterium]